MIIEKGKRYVSYGEYGLILNEFVERLKDKEYDFVYGPPRGGAPIAAHMSHFLDVNFLECNYCFLKKENPNSYNRLLLVDDVFETGKTFRELKYSFLPYFKEITMATLFHKPVNSLRPDIYVEEETDWIVFPWENK